MKDEKTEEYLEKVRRYLSSLEHGAFSDISDLFAPDMVMEQLPNRIYPKGVRAGIAQMAVAFEKGRTILASQKYEIKSHIGEGDRLALEVIWTGILAIPCGNVGAGSEMRAHSAMFFEFKDGKIVSQRNYDCFEPW